MKHHIKKSAASRGGKARWRGVSKKKRREFAKKNALIAAENRKKYREIALKALDKDKDVLGKG